MVISPLTSQQLALLEQVARDVAGRQLPPQDAQDFVQSVHLRLLERNYDVFTRFAGRSSLRTYLSVVVKRQLLDWRNAHYGKWRPSAAAARGGEHAVYLDRLINRDGLSVEEAVHVAAGRPGSPSIAELRATASKLPRRRRRTSVSADVLDDVKADTFSDPVDAVERLNADRLIRIALVRAIRELSPEDRLLVRARYYRRMPMRVVGPALDRPPKLLYRRLERALRQLRAGLVAQGVTGPDSVASSPLERVSLDN
jgi:RNA polymerase sigma factor (sigma-70 family)